MASVFHSPSFPHVCALHLSIWLSKYEREKEKSERASEKPLDVDGGDCRMKKIEMGIEGRNR
jgi:hypothetical protein